VQSQILAPRVRQLRQRSSTLRLLASRVACLPPVTLDQQFAASSRTSPPVFPALCQLATHPDIALPLRTRCGPAAAGWAGSFDSGKNSLQVKLALYQLCHVLISCLISESPNTVTIPRISGLTHLSHHTDHPSQPINQSFSLSGLGYRCARRRLGAVTTSTTCNCVPPPSVKPALRARSG
jgi:hypothetical protein